ncbi:hypothetical protein CkaCkLH20_03906 [Colletotrichum karsti]|uniref:Heparan-alpha-glucosaminide N-acetyltransferase catalytic domain-containing protein n=1 Tax=Colletotrichum karsti TaxID=1095194 RepID=A0A9P6LJI7_9PEZI|nr:uncharacterized protein CkaCkLH20_03906 [Colletotrichum karsti]KAF9878414.1 hypothetical protein CkaCkLH20_03906 [Colletotrichum karsti]
MAPTRSNEPSAGHSPHHDAVQTNDEEAIATTTTTTTTTASNGYAYGSQLNPSPPPKPIVPSPQRALAPDLLRGLLMLFMAMDHNTVGLNAWRHSTGPDEGERDSFVVHSWTWWLGYVIRTLSHLCAPGFTFLLGMGVVYFGRSRAKLGWSPARMARHFVVRGAVLTLVSVVLGWVLTMGQFWFMNVILVALAVDYVLVGFLWLGVAATEPALARLLDRFVVKDDGGERTPLIEHAGHHTPSETKPSRRAETISWHVHNAVLLVLSFVTIWWNHWLSETNGSCTTSTHATPANDFWRFWFFEVISPHVVSPFPPLAWLSFAILGLLYARVIVSRPLSVSTQICGNAAAGLFFSVLFVLTRVLRVGNLSDGCLQTPEHAAHPDANPYLTSPAAFFYIVKYPPDFAFFSFTLAGTFFLLALFAAVPPARAARWLPVLLAYGTSALFFYVVHMFILMSLCVLLVSLTGHDTGRPPPPDGRPAEGVDNLWVWFLNWAFVMAVMYPLCKWYSAFKKRRGADSVWRFF